MHLVEKVWLINIKWKFVNIQASMNIYYLIIYFGFKEFNIFVFIKQIGIICK